MATYDVVVVGLGVMGAAALAAASSRGKVLGLECASPGHDGGSSHGESRVFRTSSFENPAYTALAQRSLDAWRNLERVPHEVFIPTGLVEAGPPSSPLVYERDVVPDASSVSLEQLTATEVLKRFPAIEIPPHWVALYQREAGVLRANVAIKRLLEGALNRQPNCVMSAKATSVEQVGDSVEIRTATGDSISAGAAIVTAGPWIATLIPDLRERLRLTLQVVGWFRPSRSDWVTADKLPIFLFDSGDDAGLVYGFPDFAGLGVKAASHRPGQKWTIDSPRPDVSERERLLAPVDLVLKRLIPHAANGITASATCIYTNTSDLEFIVDRRPASPRIVFASACSGHGFKFAPAIGEMLADLACDLGATTRFPL